MNKNNFIILCNDNSDDSLEFAQYYISKHGMSESQIIPIDCSLSEILSNEDEFNDQILYPLRHNIGDNIEGIVVGYRMPGGFYDGEDIISITSRLSRINYDFEKKIKNNFYNRSIFSDGEKKQNSPLVCSRIDAPNLVFAKNIINNGQKILRQSIVNGIFYVDPYSNLEGENAQEYEDSIVNFKNNFLPKLNIPIWNTTRSSSSLDPNIPFVQNDSFVWSWFSDRSTNSFFRFSNALRIFFYNADNDGAETIRDSNNRWPFLSLNNNYACTAGAMSNPSVKGFLDITSFFRYLSTGHTIGESYLSSLPYLDWTMTLFGDPLVKCSFPNFIIKDEEKIDMHMAWKMMSDSLEKSVANLYEKEKELDEIVDLVTDIDIKEIEINLLYKADEIYIKNINAYKKDYKNLVNVLFDFPRKYYMHYGNQSLSPDVNIYLNDNNFKVSKLLSEVYNNQVNIKNMKEDGEWEFSFDVKDYSEDFVFYHFILQVSDVEDFSNILIQRDSMSVKSWFYEKEKWEFSQMSFEGVPISYVGRKVKYVSQKDDEFVTVGDRILEKGETYYFKVIQYLSEDPSIVVGEDIYSMIISN